MESRNPGAAWFVADLEVTKKSMRFPGRDSQLCAKQLTSQCGQPRYGPKYLDLSPMTDPWCHIWCSMDPIKKKPVMLAYFSQHQDPSWVKIHQDLSLGPERKCWQSRQMHSRYVETFKKLSQHPKI